jgi:cell division protein FtsZ
LIQIHFDDLCNLVRDRHSESAFAFVEANGTARSHEAMEKLLAHPLLDKGRALAEADAVLVSLTGGRDLKMAEVNRVMENINRHCDHAQIIMGAAVDKELKNHLSITVIAAKNSARKSESAGTAIASADQTAPHGATARAAGNFPASPSLVLEQREQLVTRHAGRARKTGTKMQQAQLPLAIVSKGRFDKSEPTLYKGEDLDIPTYVRRGVPLN